MRNLVELLIVGEEEQRMVAVTADSIYWVEECTDPDPQCIVHCNLVKGGKYQVGLSYDEVMKRLRASAPQ